MALEAHLNRTPMRTLAALALCISLSSAFAQTEPPAARLAEGYLAYGSFANPGLRLGLSDWRAMLPGSALLARDLRGFSRGDWQGGGYWGPGRFGRYGYEASSGDYATGSGFVGVGLDIARAAAPGTRFEQRLRIGAGIIGSEDLYGSWSRSLTGRYDTLISQQTGQMIFLDSTWTEGYSAYAYRSRIGVDASYIVRRASASRWSWHAGAGALLGFTHSGRAEVSRYTARYRQSYGSSFSYSERAILEEESFRLKSSLFAAAYAVLGLDFRLGRTSPFWSQLHFFAELRPMIQLSSLPGLSARIDSGAQSLFGLRLDLR